MADLKVNIGGLLLKNPVMTASGTFGYGEEFADFVDLSRLGGVIVKGTTLHHREGNPYPRMAETPSGMLNAVGLQNKGVNYFIENIYPRIKDIDTHFLVNVSGSSIEDYAVTAEKIAALDKIPGIELNISDCQTFAKRYRYYRDSPSSRGRRRRCRIPDQYSVGYGY